MKVGEAKQIYRPQINAYSAQKANLLKQKKELEQKMKYAGDDREIYAAQAVKLDLTYSAVDEKLEEYQGYMKEIMNQWNAKFQEINTQENIKATEKGMEDVRKIFIVVKRMTNGDTVPSSDEKKVMEYDKDLYQMAKAAQMVARMRKKDVEDYDSLWDEEEDDERLDGDEVADDQEAFMEGPSIESVEDTMSAATAGIEE